MFTGTLIGRALSAAAVAVVLLSVGTAAAQQSPHVAIVQCEDTYAWSWEDTQSSSHGLVGLAGLVGVPYETLLLGELLAETSPDYTSVWFSFCPVLDDADYAALDSFLIDYTGAGGNVFLDGPLGIFYPDPNGEFGVSYRGMAELSITLKVVDGGWFPLGGYTVTAGMSDHVVAARAGFAPGEQLSQGLVDGTEIMDLASVLDPEGAILLEITSPEDPLAYPLLVTTSLDSGARVVAIGAYGNYVGPASPFHNEPPNEYYDNQVLPYLIESLSWLEHGSGPAVGLQLSHAPMTAIGRLDGDWSGEVMATDETFLYLIDLARTTGLATAYGVVSDFVPDDGWEQVRNGGIELESYGGALGSHSATHDYAMSANLDDAGWVYETSGSLDEIRAKVTGGGFSPAVDVFINPGDTIESSDYYRFFADIELFLTHGFETSVPYASGVMDFGLPPGVDPVPVINNTLAPDFQWLYLEEWVYPVATAADNQALLLDYFQESVGRGVLYNQMWHDYAIGGNLEPVNFPATESVRPLFDVNAEHFAKSQVYMPSIDELVGKLHIAQKARHTTVRAGNTVTVTIDYAAVPTRYRPHASGMGLRVARAGGAIVSATVDGVDVPAFTSNTVILPRPSGATQVVEVETGPAPDRPRLAFVSKPIDSVTRNGDAVDVSWQSPGLHRKACLTGTDGIIVLHADTLQRSGRTVCGTVDPSSPTTALSSTVIDSGSSAFFLDRADRPISAATLEGQRVTLTLPDAPEADLVIATGGPPLEVLVNDQPTDVDHRDGRFTLTTPAGPATVAIDLMSCADADADGTSNCAGDCDDTDPAIGVCEVVEDGCCSASNSNPTSALLLTFAVLLLALRRRRPLSPGRR